MELGVLRRKEEKVDKGGNMVWAENVLETKSMKEKNNGCYEFGRFGSLYFCSLKQINQ